MGRKLDALLGRNFKTSKFKTLVKLAISRIGILKNQHQVRYSHARSDVIELLNLGHQERALLRVEHVIKEQNMVDAFTIMESYCHLLIERVMLIQNNRECPDELKEAASSLMFASSRCGEFPELLHIRGVLSSTFGKEFVGRAVELRNSCEVNPKIIQKLSTRQPSLESKLKLLKEIADERGITLNIEAMIVEEKSDVNEKRDESIARKSAKLDDPEHKDAAAYGLPREIKLDENLSESIKARKNYRDVAAAAQEAFESAAYAAAAARAAVELSRTQPQDSDSDDESGSGQKNGVSTHKKEALDIEDGIPDFPMLGHAASGGNECSNDALGFEKVHPIDNLWIERTVSASSSDSDVSISAEKKLSLNLLRQNQGLGDELDIDKVNTDWEKEEEDTQWPKPHDLSSSIDVSLNTDEEQYITQNEAINEDESKFAYQSSKLTNTRGLNFEEKLHSHINKKWVSMRTRRDHGV
ncbi:hypothetical protein PTKIN_Ptkin12aG0056300 [Pterospermum kingtungense]